MTGIIKLKNGDKVLVNLDLKDFKKAQEDGNVPGGWKDEMKQVVTVIRKQQHHMSDKVAKMHHLM